MSDEWIMWLCGAVTGAGLGITAYSLISIFRAQKEIRRNGAELERLRGER